MVTYTQRAGLMIVVISFLLTSVCYGVDTKAEATTNTSSSKTSTNSVNNVKKDSGSELEQTPPPFGVIPVDQLHEAFREERIKTLLEIDKERKATLVYLTQERRAVMEALKTELNRIAELLKSERETTMVEMEETGNRIIDHFFVRVLELVMTIIIVFIILGFIIFRIIAKRESQP